MRYVALGLGTLGVLVGVIMMVVGVNSREMNVELVGYWFLVSVVSLVILIFARVFINQRQ